MAGCACVVLVSLAMVSCSENNTAPLQVFKQEIASSSPLQTLKVDELATIQVTVKNIGNAPWPMKGIDEKNTNLVALGFHWIDSEGNAIQEGRATLSNDLMPGASATLDANIQAPPEPGNYKLRFSMVQEHVDWFDNKGAEPLVFNVTVKK